MPLDSVNYNITHDTFWAGNWKDRLRYLSQELRRIKPTHYFNFGFVDGAPALGEFRIDAIWVNDHPCTTAGCAIGYARSLWGKVDLGDFFPPESVGKALHCDREAVRAIFGFGGYLADTVGVYGCSHEGVTADMVADAIDRFLATGNPKA